MARPQRLSTRARLRLRRAGLLALAILLLCAPSATAGALVRPLIVAGPGAWLTQYATPAMATTSSVGVEFRNQDIMKHDVVSDAMGPDGQPWCLDLPAGHCPLLYTPLIGLGVTATVQGVQNAQPGAAYGFYCTLHTAMRGTLVVLGDVG